MKLSDTLNRSQKRFCIPGVCLLLPIIALLGGCAAPGTPVIGGETLIQKMPLPAGKWQVSQFPPEQNKTLETRWTSTSTKDLMQTFVLYQTGEADVTKPKRFDDESGETNCDIHFSSTILSTARRNGYPQLTWRTLCQRSSGANSIVLHKVISGNEAQYVFRRTFTTLPTKDVWLLWLSYINEISVCDGTKPDKHPCPDDLTQN